jgi:hypothetical protein
LESTVLWEFPWRTHGFGGVMTPPNPEPSIVNPKEPKV